MPVYTYRIITKENKTVEASAEGLCAWLVRRTFRKQGAIVISVERKRSKRASKRPVLEQMAQMPAYAQILFFRNFSMMLDSGISIATTLETLGKQSKGFGVPTAIAAIQRDVMNGGALAASMLRYPRLFPRYIVKTVEVGERSGSLAKTMEKVSVDLEKNYELKRKVVGAIAYPAIIFTFMLLTALLLVVFVLPQLTAMFDQLGAPLPPLTAVLQKVGNFVVAYPFELGIGLLAFLFLFTVLLRVHDFRLAAHSLLIHMPIFGPLVLEYNLVRLTRALTTLVGSGITFTYAIEASRDTLKNEAFRTALDRIHPVVVRGGTFSDAITTAPTLFPEQLRQLVIVGEQSGRLVYALEKASIHYERSVQFQTQMLTTLIEPILMLIAGLLVGSLAYSMFAPLYQVTQYI